mmetsp:Transcript_112068/g.175027  ORF Transcript_112068/g.175027 Transcript_112068/m.175027 type:complete len:340 (+) Transcript_112068:66-1085(+)
MIRRLCFLVLQFSTFCTHGLNAQLRTDRQKNHAQRRHEQSVPRESLQITLPSSPLMSMKQLLLAINSAGLHRSRPTDIFRQHAHRSIMLDSNITSSDLESANPHMSSVDRFGAVKRAFVAGATGGTGREIVNRLLSEGVAVRALVRDPSSANLPYGVETVTGDVYDYRTLPSALKDCDVVLCATGSRPDLSDPLGPYKVDNIGVGNLAAAARNAGMKKFVLVSSIAADELLYPLNIAFGVLFWKKRGEEQLQRSGLDYTIIRPGGLQDGAERRPIVMKQANTFGLPPARKQAGSILRSQVADLCVEALVTPAASNKIVEVIAVKGESEMTPEELFSSVL